MRWLLPLICGLMMVGSTADAQTADSLIKLATPGSYFPLTPETHKNTDSFQFGKPIVGTSYFYWYDIKTGEHIRHEDGSDYLSKHPPKEEMADLTWRSANWHYKQMHDMCQAGIDFMMPVYWGAPGKEKHWSFDGLPPLVAGHDRMLAEHKKDPSKPHPPMIGLFYDTSTLGYDDVNKRDLSKRVDLTTAVGRAWFYVTIRDFFSLIPPDKWARIDGKPIIFLYLAEFAAAVDHKLFDETRVRFKKDFGTDFFLVRHYDWPGKSDAWYYWGGAMGLNIGDYVAGLGAGFDDTASRAPQKPRITDRQGGKFYSSQWEKLLQIEPGHRPWMVHVETWNEWHEGTSVARAAEWGDKYIRLTAKYAKMFRAGRKIKSSSPIALAKQVRWRPAQQNGLTLRTPKLDGYWEKRTIAGEQVVVGMDSKEGIQSGPHLYFDVDDSFIFYPADKTAELVIVFRDNGSCERFNVAYDNMDNRASAWGGAFKPTRWIEVGNTNTWRTVKLKLTNIRFTNRAHEADFRITPAGKDKKLAVREVIVQKLAD